MKKLPLIVSVAFLAACSGYQENFLTDNGEVVRFVDDDLGLTFGIDSNMDQVYIDAALAAVEEFDNLDFIHITYNMTYSPQVYQFYFSYYSDEVVDICSEDDSDVVACNTMEYIDNQVYTAGIYFNINVLPYLDEEWYPNIAIHELGHTFGLIDLYDAEDEELSIMYYNAEDIILPGLTEFDIENLRQVYGDEDGM